MRLLKIKRLSFSNGVLSIARRPVPGMKRRHKVEARGCHLHRHSPKSPCSVRQKVQQTWHERRRWIKLRKVGTVWYNNTKNGRYDYPFDLKQEAVEDFSAVL